jgi:hypothetical protein
MKKYLLSLLICFYTAFLFAQTNESKLPAVDKSPMDMAYYPLNYPVLKIQDKAAEPLVARVIYSRPLKNNRTIYGELVEYNTIWRLGANEATEIEFFRNVTIGGKKIAKGRYTLFAVVNPNQWTLILNKDTDTWGAFKYDEKKDALRTQVPVTKLDEAVGIELVIAWDTVMVTLPISLK